MTSEQDLWIGQNVANARGEMSQQALADAMREAGHKWSQSTVWSVEKGDRPLRLTEASDLSRLLDRSLITFLVPSEEQQLMHAVWAGLREVRRRQYQVSGAAVELLAAQANLRRDLAAAKSVDMDRLEGLRQGFRDVATEAEAASMEDYVDTINERLDENRARDEALMHHGLG